MLLFPFIAPSCSSLPVSEFDLLVSASQNFSSCSFKSKSTHCGEKSTHLCHIWAVCELKRWQNSASHVARLPVPHSLNKSATSLWLALPYFFLSFFSFASVLPSFPERQFKYACSRSIEFTSNMTPSPLMSLAPAFCTWAGGRGSVGGTRVMGLLQECALQKNIKSSIWHNEACSAFSVSGWLRGIRQTDSLQLNNVIIWTWTFSIHHVFVFANFDH